MTQRVTGLRRVVLGALAALLIMGGQPSVLSAATSVTASLGTTEPPGGPSGRRST